MAVFTKVLGYCYLLSLQCCMAMAHRFVAASTCDRDSLRGRRPSKNPLFKGLIRRMILCSFTTDLSIKFMRSINSALGILLVAGIFAGCKKDGTGASLLPGDDDYTSYQVVKAVHVSGGVTDTTHYLYNGPNQSYIVRYNNDPSRSLTTHFLRHSNYYTSENYSNNLLSGTGYYRVNSMGYIDSAAVLRANNTFNNINQYTYNREGYNVTETTNFITYQNHYTKYYVNNNYSYWIYDFTNVTNPATNKRDSIAFEFYTDKPQHIFYKSHLPQLYGKAVKNLVKKRTYYNTAKVAYQTWEYSYDTNEKGLVTKEIWNVYTQPGAILNRSDTTYFSYNK